jgi:hypothetical protein
MLDFSFRTWEVCIAPQIPFKRYELDEVLIQRVTARSNDAQFVKAAHFPNWIEDNYHISSTRRGGELMCRIGLCRGITPIVAILLFLSVGCDTPDTVSKFCSSSVTAISSTTSVLADLGPSCLREVNDNTYTLGSFQLPAASDPSCDAITAQANATIAAAKLLSEYFSTLNSLATVGTSAASTDAGTLATDATTDAGLTANQKTAITSLAQDLTTGIISAYQYRKLAEDLPKAKQNVDNIVAALISIIQTNYLNQLLNDEEKKLANPYKMFLSRHNSPEATLSLDQQWQADEQTLQTRRASAKSAVAALQTLQKGFDQLADNASKVKAEEVPGLLAPYVSQLQTLIPQIQKAF